MSRVIHRPVVLLLVVATVAAASLGVSAFAQPNREVNYSHLSVTPPVDCLVPGEGDATPLAEASPAADEATPVVLAEGDFQIEAAAWNSDPVENGLPHQLRLYTVRVTDEGSTRSGTQEPACEIGYSIAYVVSGEVEFTHHAALGGGTGFDDAGAVSYVASPEINPQMLPAGGAPVLLRPGDSIFLEQAIVTYRAVGGEALLMVAGVSPEWLPCSGGGCN